MDQGRIVRVSGPLVVAEGMEDARMFDVVRVSDQRLIGEIIELKSGKASIQVYENTGGLGVGVVTAKNLQIYKGDLSVLHKLSRNFYALAKGNMIFRKCLL